MNKEYWVKSEWFNSLSTLPFYKEMQLINYEDLTQDALFISLYLSRKEVTLNGRMLL